MVTLTTTAGAEIAMLDGRRMSVGDCLPTIVQSRSAGNERRTSRLLDIHFEIALLLRGNSLAEPRMTPRCQSLAHRLGGLSEMRWNEEIQKQLAALSANDPSPNP